MDEENSGNELFPGIGTGTAVTVPPLAEYVLPPVTMLSQEDDACGEDITNNLFF